MELKLDFISELPACSFSQEECLRIAKLVLENEGVTRDCDLSLSFVSDEKMRELNVEWRGVDSSTDVLSIECERPEDLDLNCDEPCELGDIVLAPNYIEAQAKDFKVTFKQEMSLLLIHGLLHLLGYDHENDEEAAIMEAREDELLALALGKRLPSVSLVRH